MRSREKEKWVSQAGSLVDYSVRRQTEKMYCRETEAIDLFPAYKEGMRSWHLMHLLDHCPI